MSESDQEQQLVTNNMQSSWKRKVLVVGIAVFLSCVVAMVAATFVVTLASSRSLNGMESSGNVRRSTIQSAEDSNMDDTAGFQLNREVQPSSTLAKDANEHASHNSPRQRRQAISKSSTSNRRNSNLNKEMSCFSHASNRTIPAAHIKGYGRRFTHPNSSPTLAPPGYQQRWRCSEFDENHRYGHAFVDGGMIYNQTDKSLRVPTCGYYHVFSQILFDVQMSHDGHDYASVFHVLKFHRNCYSWPESSALTVVGKSSAHLNEPTTTYTGDVVKLCAGGRIWVEIPAGSNGVPCCPTGDEHATFMGAVLIAKTACHWPPTTMMDNLNSDYD